MIVMPVAKAAPSVLPGAGGGDACNPCHDWKVPIRTIFAESLHTLVAQGDIWEANVVLDEKKGLGVPGRALFVRNEAAVAFLVQIASSSDDFCEPIYVPATAGAEYHIPTDYGVRIVKIRVTALNANAIFTLVVYPGVHFIPEPSVPQPSADSPLADFGDEV